MKGIVFSEFLEMVEERFGYELVDKLIIESKLPSKGVYTTVGTYDFGEMVILVKGLSKHTGLEISFLLKEYGFHFFSVMQKSYPHFLDRTKTAFQFLASIENHIHIEVQKLYPEAELPSFDTNLFSPGHLEMIYRSERSMADFAEGLIEKSLEFYGEEAEIVRENIAADGSIVKFILRQNN
jgi:hypothetical protein